LINLNNVNNNDGQCKNNSSGEQTHSIHTLKKKKSIFHCNSKPNFNHKNSLILFTFFSIVLPIGIQPQLQFIEAFDESVVDDNIDGMRDDSNDNGNGKTNKNVGAFQDPASTDLTSPTTTTPSAHIGDQSTDGNNKVVPNDESKEGLSLHAGTQSSYKTYRDYVNSNSNENASNNIVSDDKPGTELSATGTQIDSTDSQIDTANSNVNDDAYGKVNENGILKGDSDNSSAESISSTTLSSQSQSDLTSQPRYNSYRDYIDNSNANKNNDNGIISDDKVGTEPSSPNSGTSIAVIGNDNDNANKNLVVADNQSDTTQSGSSDFQSQINSEPKYKSYRDYIENKSSPSNQDINVTSYTQATGLSSMNSQIGTLDSNANDDNTNDRVAVTDDRSSAESGSITSFSSSSASASASASSSSNKVYGDFNGDGFDDLAIGVPFESVGSIQYAGGVEVIYGSSGGLSATSPRADQFWTQDSTNIEDSAEAEVNERLGDNFGRSLASGDFNGDGRDDLAIGVPGEDVGSISDAGGVEVIYGSSDGLSATSARADQFWTQDSADINDHADDSDEFGWSLASGDFNNDGRDDLAIGVQGESVGSIQAAGGVEVIYGSSGGLSATTPRADQFWTQDSTDINDQAEDTDEFGSAIASGDFNGDGKDDLAIGIRFEGVGSIDGAGAVEVIYGSSGGLSATTPRADQFWTQDSTDINDQAEFVDFFGSSLTSGDFNGDGKDDLAIGVPYEDVGSISDAGAVEVIYGSSGGLSATSPLADQFWTQDSADIDNIAEDGDHFGWSLASGDFNGDGRVDLAVGVESEDVGSISGAGAVEVIYSSSGGLSATSARADQFWTQDSTDINDQAEFPDLFGSSLASGDFNGDGRDDLAIGVPQESVGSIGSAGGVEVIYGSSGGLSATSPRADQFWTQDTTDINDHADPGDFFGDSLA
jgi:hypothetical protein